MESRRHRSGDTGLEATSGPEPLRAKVLRQSSAYIGKRRSVTIISGTVTGPKMRRPSYSDTKRTSFGMGAFLGENLMTGVEIWQTGVELPTPVNKFNRS